MKYLPRQIEPTLRKYCELFPVVGLTGPRQSGKSTLLKHLFTNTYRYISFDEADNIANFYDDPNGFIKKYNDLVIFDEAQKVPELFDYIKVAVDNDRRKYGKFILTGSNQFYLLKQITESLAGRIGLLSLLPFQKQEIPKKLQSQQLLFGGYPELVNRNYLGTREWYASYLQSYLEKDVRNVINVGNLRDFHKLVQLLAARTAQELNMNSLATEIGINIKTIQSWISILEASYIVFLLPCYYHNLGKRIVKRPKLYFYDTGLLCYLTGIKDMNYFETGPLCGPIFENYLVSEISKTIQHNNKDQQLYYFRSNLGLEADLIIEDRDSKQLLFTEIKYSHTARTSMVENIKKLIAKEKEHRAHVGYSIRGLLLYSGKEQGTYFDSIDYKNWKIFLA